MYPMLIHVTRMEHSSRLLALFRPLLLFPHYFWQLVYGLIAFAIQFVSFWAIIFTGRHPQMLWDIVEGYFRYSTKLTGYSLFLMDSYPPFLGGDERPCAIRIRVRYPEKLSRITTLFRPLLLVPHLFILWPYFFYIMFIQMLTVPIVLVLGRLPDWLHRQLTSWFLYYSRLNAYSLLLVDEYPPFHGMQPLAAETMFQDSED